MTGDLLSDGQGERWARIEALFGLALDTPADLREALLAARCDDELVRADVRRLVARHESLSGVTGESGDFLDRLDRGRAAELLEGGRGPSAVGRYEILRRLGRGATGVVYLARDLSLDRRVALKLLDAHLSDRPGAVRRFMEEARTASALDHPHIATVHEIGRADDGCLYITMAYYEGETLRDRLERGLLPVAEAIRIASEIADGLSAAHAKGIVHRDIKPENVLLTLRGACIVDFGIAKVAGHTHTLSGAAARGTTAYMSPEQTRGVDVDHRSDLWSLGVVLYEMLTRVRPFRADGGEALVYAIRHDLPAQVATLRPDVASPVIQVVDRCLEKDPAWRYQSAGDLLSALRAPVCVSHPARSSRPRWKRVGLAVGCVAAVTVAELARPGRPSAGDPLAQAGTVLPLPRHPGAIAILSLSEGSPDQPKDGEQYLTAGMIDGISDELVRILSSTPGMRVASPASVRILAQAGADVREMERRLGVTAVLRWALRHRNDLITVDARLIRASDGRDLWSHTYAHPVGQVATIPGEIGLSVAGALGVGPPDSAKVPRGATRDPRAYDLYLRGRFAHGKLTPAGLDEAALLFREAIARDSGFALAYTWLAEVQVRTWTGASGDRWGRAKPLVAKALAIDSTVAYAHRMAGYIAMWQDRDWPLAEHHFRQALAFDSSDIWNYHFYASYFAATGRTEQSLAMAQRAIALDPVSSVTATQVGLYRFWQRDYTGAIEVLERALLVDTTWWRKMPMTLGRAYLAVGRSDEAIEQFRRAGLESSHGFDGPTLLAYGLGIAGRDREARALAAQYMERARASSARPIDLVAVHLGLADTARALDWLEQVPGDLGARFFLLADPMFDPLRDSPRFRRVLQRLGLAEAARLAASESGG